MKRFLKSLVLLTVFSLSISTFASTLQPGKYISQHENAQLYIIIDENLRISETNISYRADNMQTYSPMRFPHSFRSTEQQTFYSFGYIEAGYCHGTPARFRARMEVYPVNNSLDVTITAPRLFSCNTIPNGAGGWREFQLVMIREI